MKQVPIVRWPDKRYAAEVLSFLSRPAFDGKAEAAARRVLEGVRTGGDRAVVRYARQFDGVTLDAQQLRVPPDQVAAARRCVTPEFRKAARQTHRRVMTFARAGLRRDWRIGTPGGGTLGETFRPFERVGVYVPAGKAPLASTALMTATLARAAGVAEIVACTPCDRDGRVHAETLMALGLAGATEIYRVGGIHAIALMAFGTETVQKVQKIVGPGGPYVTAAKRQVYGSVALDLVAGPSEIAVLADETAEPACVAADLLSQAEHGTGWEKALLVTTSRAQAERVRRELELQVTQLSRAVAARRVMEQGMLLAVVKSLEQGVELCNRFAPEHLELLVQAPRKWLKRVTCAGAVLMGPWSPESAGDFAAGPSHVLPTGGAAAMFSGLTVDDFRRRSSVIELTRRDLREMLPIIEAFGKVEGLDGHARSARIRFER